MSLGSLPEKGATPASLRESIIKDDPHFDERMRIMRKVIGEELIKISAVMEPKLREGLARSIARRFDEKQLRDINSFLATDSGRASTSTRPSRMAVQIASAFGSASTSEYVEPSCRSRWTSPFPTIGLLFALAHRSARRLKFSADVNIALYSTASNRCA